MSETRWPCKGAAAVWLLYVQHQLESIHWADDQRWTFNVVALEVSSYYDLPDLLHWVAANIGFHHLHHLCSKVPNYRLRECFEQNVELRTAAKRLILPMSLKAARLSLWDESTGKLVTFRHETREMAADFLATQRAGAVAAAAPAAEERRTEIVVT